MIPTFFGITILSFFFINMAPGGPIEQKIQTIRFGAAAGGGGRDSSVSRRGDTGVNEEILEALKKQYGFDKPVHIRYWIWLKNIVKLDFGESFTYETPVIDVIVERFPVSLQFGIVSFFLTYLICVPLGVAMAIRANSLFDRAAQLTLFFFYSVPSLILGIVLIVVFAGASHYNWFPTGGFVSDNYAELGAWGKFVDRVHHFILPLTVYLIGGFTSLTMLMRNSMLDVIKQDYIRTARAKGLGENIVNFKHALRNALIPIATGIGGFLGVFLSGSLIIEAVFRLNGIGLLSYNSLLARDYNVIMGLIFLSSVVIMFGRLISDIIYVLIDPRIDFK
jgi:microcin C transport system permease protein